MKRLFRIFGLALLVFSAAFFVYSCSDSGTQSDVEVYTYEVVNTYPHNPDAYTQGLVFEDGFLYEGTGLQGRSSLRKVELKTGSILKIHKLKRQFFGEGITICGDKIIQLTWHSNVGFVYDKNSFELLREFNYPEEGWGVTYDGKRLITSDGTSTLRFLDPETFEQICLVKVHYSDKPVNGINELEYIHGSIYANIWQTERIVKIDPQTGQVISWIDLTGLLKRRNLKQKVDVLNGIAYDAENDRLFVTGKLWPRLFEIKLVRKK
ncbi:glutaminyl-peptide cyclotransferase [Planctomycetota bacterium]